MNGMVEMLNVMKITMIIKVQCLSYFASPCESVSSGCLVDQITAPTPMTVIATAIARSIARKVMFIPTCPASVIPSGLNSSEFDKHSHFKDYDSTLFLSKSEWNGKLSLIQDRFSPKFISKNSVQFNARNEIERVYPTEIVSSSPPSSRVFSHRKPQQVIFSPHRPR